MLGTDHTGNPQASSAPAGAVPDASTSPSPAAGSPPDAAAPDAPQTIVVRPARTDDVPQIAALVEPFVRQRKLLPRTLAELNQLVRTGFVAVHGDRIVGFATLEIYSPKLAEIRSLAVDERYHGRGIGKRLVEACVGLARQRQIMEVMAITASEGVFRACGFDFTLPEQRKALFLRTGPSGHDVVRPTDGPAPSRGDHPAAPHTDDGHCD